MYKKLYIFEWHLPRAKAFSFKTMNQLIRNLYQKKHFFSKLSHVYYLQCSVNMFLYVYIEITIFIHSFFLDEYFLTNVKTVDDITEERCRRVAIAGVPWSRGVEAALSTWPCISSAELFPPPLSGPLCTSCRLSRSTTRLQIYGQPYNPATLEPCHPPDPRIPYEKVCKNCYFLYSHVIINFVQDLFLCRTCSLRVKLYSRVSHQKYLMFIECNKRVAEKRLQDPHKDTTIILNELLADEPWLSQVCFDKLLLDV